jgi:DNA-binding CsgD family transcriptional regulator/tetratricopeptide (TPR) repeat protein
MGLHTGEAVRGSEGWIGYAVHHAARIGDVAHGGQVVVSGSTVLHADTAFPPDVRIVHLGVHRLRGAEKPERLYQLAIDGLPDSFPPLATRVAATSGGEPPLFERESELAVLGGAIDAAVGGAARLVVVEGPAGIGKTRLLGVVRRRSEEAGARVLAARAGEFEREFSYGIVRQLLEPALALASAEERAELLNGPAALAASLFDPTAPAAERGAEEDVSFAMLHGLYWVVANFASQRPLVLAVDDLHWCDAPSLRFLTYLVRRMETLPVLVAVGVRTAEPGVDELLLGEITADPLAVVIRPAPLSEEAAVEYLRERFGGGADEEFCRSCHAAVGGNPLLLHELANGLETDGVAPTAENAGRVTELGPSAVSRAILLRLVRLAPAAGQLARVAAILGDGADPALAAELAGCDRAGSSRAALDLTRADILRTTEPLNFVHPIVRAAIHQDILPGDRSRLHRRAADLLTERGAVPEQIAGHLMLALPESDASVVERLRTAAARALAGGAADAAVAYLRRALEEPPPAELRARILLELGLAERRVDGPAAARHLAEAVELLEDPVERGEASLELGRALWYTDRHREALDVFTAASDAVGELDPDLHERLEAELISSAWWEPDLNPIAVLRMRVVAEQPRAGGLGTDLLLAGEAYHVARLGEDLERAVELAERALKPGRLAAAGSVAFYYATFALVLADRFEAARAAYDAAFEEVRRRGDIFMSAGIHLFRGHLLSRVGELAAAEEDLREALALSGVHGMQTASPYNFGFLASALLQRGEVEEAATLIERAGLPEELPETGHLTFFLDARARVRAARGDAARALADLERLGALTRCLRTANPAFTPWRSETALVLHGLGRADEARALAREEVELARRWGAPRALGIALRACGLVEGGAKGLAALREAVDVLEPSPARLELAASLSDLGAALRRGNQRAEARDVLRRALELAEVVGAAPLAERARTELTATGARPRSVRLSGVESLTASERRVAEMAADGLTNRQIAQALFVTPKTVEVHLSSVYRKLEIASRSELARVLPASASV